MSTYTLTRSVSRVPDTQQSNWRMRVDVVSADPANAPEEIFVYHRIKNYRGMPVADVYSCTASVAQLSEIGTAPSVDPTGPTPFYRRSWLEFDLRSEEEVESIWLDLLEEVRHLVANLDAAVDPAVTVTATV